MRWEYIQPETCQEGGRYYYRHRANGKSAGFRKVKFIGYRPHPGEVIVDDGQRSVVIHRIDLYQKVSFPDRC